ncbi:hypothetical protein [Poseidonibacter ostreae]|uniref:HNH endonuclease 5 domain-containing protein n=1 Tax=Poseidonibacter ostreae TaxID=2654171 RepID=A0A6L4WNX7_9BACT|nr:hypothetical protein [Poseidonibacter ostreae]KAB7884617.1 hypothetical protein GBG19_15530 [Poseidonibacter ostreae]
MNCWICGAIADSGEHKIKKSLLKKVYSDDFKNKEMRHIKYGEETKLPGPNSNKIKFKKVICSKCNNSRTQSHDASFDIFIDFIIKHYELINEKRIIDFKEIYGEKFPEQQTNLFKYFVKIFGCDLSENNFIVPSDIVQLIDKTFFKTRLKITFSINEQIVTSNSPTNLLYGNGYLITTDFNLNSRLEVDTKYRFEMNLSYLRVNFFYNTFTDIGLGSDWIADKQYLYLGSSQEMNKEHI